MSLLDDLERSLAANKLTDDEGLAAYVGYTRELAKALDFCLTVAGLDEFVRVSATLVPQYQNALSNLGLSVKDVDARIQAKAVLQRTKSQTAKIVQETALLKKKNAGMVDKSAAGSVSSAVVVDDLRAMRSRRGLG